MTTRHAFSAVCAALVLPAFAPAESAVPSPAPAADCADGLCLLPGAADAAPLPATPAGAECADGLCLLPGATAPTTGAAGGGAAFAVLSPVPGRSVEPSPPAPRMPIGSATPAHRALLT